MPPPGVLGVLCCKGGALCSGEGTQVALTVQCSCLASVALSPASCEGCPRRATVARPRAPSLKLGPCGLEVVLMHKCVCLPDTQTHLL